MPKPLLKTVTILMTAVLLLPPVITHADDADDVVVLTDGSHLSGVLVAEDSQGVRIRLADGSVHSLAPKEVLEVRRHGEPNPFLVAPDLTPDPATGTAVFPPVTAVPIIPIPPPSTVSSTPALAPKKGVRKFELGVRLGVAFPMGQFEGDGVGTSSTSLSDAFFAKFPVLIEAGYDATPKLMLGVYAQYALIIDKTGDGTACSAGTSCSDHDVELGVQGQYHFAPSEPIDAWLGIGLGYELESETVTMAGESHGYSLAGPQFLKLQVGADLKVGHVATIGPFLSFSLAEYTISSGDGSTEDIPATALHEWLSLGAKGTFKIGG